MGPGFRRDDEGVEPSHRRQQLVAAIIGVEFSAALPSDRGTTRGGGGAGRGAERAAEAVGGFGRLAGGKGRAGGGDAEHQKCSGDNLDGQSHGPVPPVIVISDAWLTSLYHLARRVRSVRSMTKSARSLHKYHACIAQTLPAPGFDRGPTRVSSVKDSS